MGDEWNGLADLLAGLIEKYADVLDIDSLPDPILNEKQILMTGFIECMIR